MGAPFISVIIPAHNESGAIRATLDAVIAQDYDNYEIVVACNGCTDNTAEICRGYEGVKVFESGESGMSFGKNFGAENATGELFVFVDADTLIPQSALKIIAQAVEGKSRIIGTVAGVPDKGGIIVRGMFFIANLFTWHKKVHAPGGVMIMQRSVFEEVGGFSPELPQGTSTDLILRARKVGVEYLFFFRFKAITSSRRFEKNGVVRQMLSWRRNHKLMEQGNCESVRSRKYDNIRRNRESDARS